MNFIIRGGYSTRQMIDRYILVRIKEDDGFETSLFSIDHDGYLPVTIFGNLIHGVDEV